MTWPEAFVYSALSISVMTFFCVAVRAGTRPAAPSRPPIPQPTWTSTPTGTPTRCTFCPACLEKPAAEPQKGA